MTLDRRHFLGLGGAAAMAAGLAPLLAARSGRAAAAASFPYALTDAQWRERLTREQYQVLRREGTERPYSSPLNDEHRKGGYACAGCTHPLFSSSTKFESGTGWPSFWQPLAGAVGETRDRSFGRSVPGAPTAVPSTIIVPSWNSSRAFTHLISVDFPEPDGPHTTTTSPLETDVVQFRNT